MKCESHTFNTDVKALYLCQPGDGNKYFVVCGLIITFEVVCFPQDFFRLRWADSKPREFFFVCFFIK